MIEISFNYLENSTLGCRKYSAVNKNNTLMKKSMTQKTGTVIERQKMVKPYWNLIWYITSNKSKPTKIQNFIIILTRPNNNIGKALDLIITCEKLWYINNIAL